MTVACIECGAPLRFFYDRRYGRLVAIDDVPEPGGNVEAGDPIRDRWTGRDYPRLIRTKKMPLVKRYVRHRCGRKRRG